MKRLKWQYFLMGMLTMALVLIVIPNILSFFNIHLGISSQDIGEKVNVLERYIDKYYWKDIEKSKIEEYTLKGMLYSLEDKYSTYYTEEEYKEVTADLKGIYYGIGAVMKQINDEGGIVIQEVYDESPAMKAGLKAGDRLIKVNGESVKMGKLSQVTKLIKGNNDTKVIIVVERKDKELTFEATRGELKIKTIKYKELENKIGYISISEFDDETTGQFIEALKALNEAKVKGIIFDVRNNGGGSLSVVTKMLNQLLPEGLMLSVKNKEATLEEYKSTNETYFDKPCVVLINEHSASASEVFAGALQDRGVATLVGSKSFGKGIVQTIFSLKYPLGGGAVKLTTAEYFLPSGRSIHQVGLEPDVNVKQKEGKEDLQLKAAIKEMEVK